ncbi:MAG: hypothetical protein NTY91_00450 [Euryarchaeota archaeon]|nr:hypothetical protein [Euryarchaeota archaeon]
MKRTRFLGDLFGISMMYDAVFFIIMVSLAGVILLPVLRTDIALESSVDKHREEIVDETLHTFLVTRADFFEYRFCGNLIDEIAGHIGIDNTSNGLYGSVTHWLLAHEQRHKTYATLLAEYLGCQFRLPFSFIGTNQMNIFVGDFEQQLSNETERFFSSLLGEKYHYNLSAWWHPLRGVPFGGEFNIGEHPPAKDCYVAQSFFMMPYTPIFSVGNHTIIFTKHWLKHQLFDNDVGLGRSSIPAIANITIVLENYTSKRPPYDTRENATKATKENLSDLVYGFLIDGITNETNATVFPGIVHTTLSYGFEKIKNMTSQFLDKALNESFGASIRSVDRLFSGLNSSAINPLSQAILMQLNTTLDDMFNGSFDSLNDAFDACESAIKERIILLIQGYIDSLLEVFVDTLFDVIDTIMDFSEMLIDLLFDCISLNKAEVMLTIWVVRE